MNLKELKLKDYQEIADMANLYERTTGINTRIYISSKEGKHGPRVKVYSTDRSKSFSLSIEDDPKVLAGDASVVTNKMLKQAKQWVSLNKDVLVYYWSHPEMDILDLLNSIKKVS